MNDQLSLFDELPDPGENRIGAFHAPDKGAPETERAAAIAEYPKSGTDRLTALHALAAAGDNGLTDWEGSIVTGLYLYTYAPRRVDLKKSGWVEDSGKRRPTPRKKSPAVVWWLTEAGRYWYAQRKPT